MRLMSSTDPDQTLIDDLPDRSSAADRLDSVDNVEQESQSHENDEFKLPPTPSLAIIVMSNVLLQVRMFASSLDQASMF